jgi:hypothetical protein
MKAIFILISIVLLNSIISIDIYLNDGIEKTVNNLVANQTYCFYINVTQYQAINVSLISSYMGIKSSPISYTNISEYSDTSSSHINRKNKEITSSIKDNAFISSFSYIIAQYYTKYITLEMIPVYNLENITIKIDIGGGGYDLVEGVPKNITNLKAGFPYFFFIPVTKFQTFSVSLNMSLTANEPFGAPYFYEFENRSTTTYINRLHYSVPLSIKNNEYISNFDYSHHRHNHRVNYFCFVISPNYNLAYLVAKVEKNGGLYQLYSGSSKSFAHLKAGYENYYYIPANQYQMARISLNMSSSTRNIPFSYLNIQEYSINTFESYENNKFINITTNNITTSSKNNEYFTSFKYSNYKNNTQYIALLIRPKYNIDLLTLKIDVVDNKYDLSPKNKKTIYNLTSGDVYYFYIDTSENKIIEFNLTSNDYFSLNIKIYELRYNYSLVEDDDKSRKDGILDSKNNSFNYIAFTSNQKVAIEISPNTDIKSISAEFIYPSLERGQSNFPIILCIILLVLLIVCFIVCFYKRKRAKSKNELSGALYPANESSNDQQQYIGQPFRNDEF